MYIQKREYINNYYKDRQKIVEDSMYQINSRRWIEYIEQIKNVYRERRVD